MSLPALIARAALGAIVLLAIARAACATSPPGTQDVAAVFAERHETAVLMRVEAALARAQAAAGVIPAQAAAEITATADPANAPARDLAEARQRVGHRMVALIDVWRRRLSPEAANYLHHGATTVDIYDTALVLQLLDALRHIAAGQERVEQRLRALAIEHRSTPMMGRTLGQHALPITFGKKLSVWIGELDRHRQRLCEVRARLRRSAILKGPVGSYAGLGDQGAGIERRFAAELGLDEPYADDWHGARDVFAEVALDLALLSKSLGRLGQEIFLLQMTDIGEVSEAVANGVVGSSSMPHKINPILSEELIYSARRIPREAAVILDDVVNFFERDNTSRANSDLAGLVASAAQMLSTAGRLLDNLRVNPPAMRANIDRTHGLFRSPAVVLRLEVAVGRAVAEKIVRRAAHKAHSGEIAFADALMAEPEVRRHLTREAVLAILDPVVDLDTAARQVDAVVAASLHSKEDSCATR